jgi:hypothetical protein
VNDGGEDEDVNDSGGEDEEDERGGEDEDDEPGSKRDSEQVTLACELLEVRAVCVCVREREGEGEEAEREGDGTGRKEEKEEEGEQTIMNGNSDRRSVSGSALQIYRTAGWGALRWWSGAQAQPCGLALRANAAGSAPGVGTAP